MDSIGQAARARSGWGRHGKIRWATGGARWHGMTDRRRRGTRIASSAWAIRTATQSNPTACSTHARTSLLGLTRFTPMPLGRLREPFDPSGVDLRAEVRRVPAAALDRHRAWGVYFAESQRIRSVLEPPTPSRVAHVPCSARAQSTPPLPNCRSLMTESSAVVVEPCAR